MARRSDWEDYLPEDERWGDDAYGNDDYAPDGYEPYEYPGDYDYTGDYAEDYGDGGYDGEFDDSREGAAGVMRYAGDHNWSLALLLALVPPVGVALLWARRRFRRRGRVLLTALALLWLALLVYLIVVRPILARPATIEVLDAPEPTADVGQTNPVVVPDELLPSGVSVYVSANSPFYHQMQDCRAFPAADAVTVEDRNISVSRGLMACPYCLGGEYSESMFDLTFVNNEIKDQSGTMVYCNNGSDSFHVDPNCAQLGSGRAVTLQDALLMGKTNCSVCCPEAARQVFCTVDGRYYHYEAECSGMRDARLVKLPEAMVLGKSACPVCIKDVSGATLQTGDENSDATYYVYATRSGTYYHILPNCSGMKNAVKVSLKQMLAARRPACPVCCPNAEMTVYAERGNPYYHSAYNCSNMANPSSGTLAEALANGLQRCPVCWVSTAEAGTP